MDKYLINENTILLMSYNDKTKVLENNISYLINLKIIDIIDESCKYYGSSYKGRVSASNYLLGISYKVPIILSEYNEIIMFPTSSQRDKNCIWINYSYVKNFYSLNNKVIIEFKNSKKIELDISKSVINNQILKSSRLESILKSKKY